MLVAIKFISKIYYIMRKLNVVYTRYLFVYISFKLISVTRSYDNIATTFLTCNPVNDILEMRFGSIDLPYQYSSRKYNITLSLVYA